MKKHFRYAAVIILAAALLFGILPLVSYAKDMEECYHCNKTGQFHCDNCNNKGTVICDGCGGKGRFECPGEEGKGKCDNGYYVCPSCNGDGLSRPIPADGNAGPCGQCGGSGKLECWHCHGAAMLVCDRCNGEGQCACQNGNCIEARKINYKCPYCKGTGYLGDGPDFPPEWNDGVHNVPVKGDHIITDHATWTGYYYGTGETDKDKQQENDNSEARDPATGRDYVWFIDIGPGAWDINGQSISVKRNGVNVSGKLDVKLNEPFTVDGITDRNTHVYLITSDGYKTELIELNGDHEYSVANRSPKDRKLPFEVSLYIEYIEGSAPEGDPVNPGSIQRDINFGSGSWTLDNGVTVTALIRKTPVSGTVKVDESESIQLQGLQSNIMTVYLRGENDFAVKLIPTGDGEVNIGRYEPEESVLADGILNFVITLNKEDEHQEDDHGNEEHHDGDIPNNRNSDFDITSPSEENGGKSTAAVHVGKMTDEQQRYYAGLSDQELTGIIDTVKEIVKTADPGRFDEGEDAFFNKLAHDNGFESMQNARIFPIYFDGHIDIGFPVCLTVKLEKGQLDGGTDIFVYHQLPDGSIESLGKAEYGTYEDGSVESVSFYTTGFSTFFTAAKELDFDNAGNDSQPDQNGTEPKGSFPTAVIIIIIICVIIAAAAVVIIIVKKNGKKASDKIVKDNR